MSRRARLPAVLPAVLLAAAALAGCNDAPRIDEEETIANTVETLLQECGQRSGPAVYDLLAEDTRRLFLEAGDVLDGCREVIALGDAEEATGPDAYFRARVTDVFRRGDQAIAVVELDEERTEVKLLDTGLEWFVSNPPRYEPVGVDDVP
jgi:hypothetical protein